MISSSFDPIAPMERAKTVNIRNFARLNHHLTGLRSTKTAQILRRLCP